MYNLLNVQCSIYEHYMWSILSKDTTVLYVYTEQYPAEGLFLFPICQSNFSCQNVSKLNTKRIYSSCYNIAVSKGFFNLLQGYIGVSANANNAVQQLHQYCDCKKIYCNCKKILQQDCETATVVKYLPQMIIQVLTRV